MLGWRGDDGKVEKGEAGRITILTKRVTRKKRNRRKMNPHEKIIWTPFVFPLVLSACFLESFTSTLPLVI